MTFMDGKQLKTPFSGDEIKRWKDIKKEIADLAILLKSSQQQKD